jgi:hypothetical protein
MPANQTTTDWHKEGITDRFLALYATGASHSIIAAKLNAEFETSFSRHSCIGKANRLKLAPRTTSFNPHESRHKRKEPQGLPTKLRPGYVRRYTTHNKTQPRVIDGEPYGPGIHFDMLGKNACRYTVADTYDARVSHLFCGLATPEDDPWCPFHRQVATRPFRSGPKYHARYWN